MDHAATMQRAYTRFRLTGTHEGEFLGIPATGGHVDVQGMDIVRLDDRGRAVEHWGVLGTPTMMQQLGLIPEGPPS